MKQDEEEDDEEFDWQNEQIFDRIECVFFVNEFEWYAFDTKLKHFSSFSLLIISKIIFLFIGICIEIPLPPHRHMHTLQ